MVIRQIGTGLIGVGALMAVLCAPCALAADPPEKPATEKADSDKAASKDAAADRYAVPEDADVAQLLAFIKKVRSYVPTSAEERQDHYVKGNAATEAAAERIKAIATAEDKSLKGYDEAMALLLYLKARSVQTTTDEEQQKLIDEIRTALQSTSEPSNYLLSAAQSTAMSYEYNKKPDRAAELYREFGDILAKNPDPDIAHRGATLEGAARRVTLLGKPLEIHGTLMDGSTFDWGSYRGRVVLVDFWATWCGPCLGEIPNVKHNYEAYHDKGFDVVAISLDRDRAKLDKFLEDNPKPWANLHDGDWKDNDVATYYGIMGIPTVILVDTEGKVVSTRARGPELGRLLAELLGSPAEKTGDEAGDATDKASKSD